ncbi:MAG: winged helix-turn-helix transcriptional regulator [Coriobacteriales bacterium]|jgi:DNA-binding HxlR family transcriptional regulator
MKFEEQCPCTEACPMDLASQIIGGKWKIKIICTLHYSDALRYNEIKRKVPGITPTMLASSLRELVDFGIVNRVQYDEMPVRVEYSLTETGKSLVPVLISLRDWSANYGVELDKRESASR